MGENAIRVIELSHAQEWDRIVRSFGDHDVYSLSGYVKAFQIHGDGQPVLFYYEGGGLRGFNVAMKRDIAQDPHFSGRLAPGTWFDLATPYGYGGWLLEGSGDTEELDRAYSDRCAAEHIVSEFVRYHPVWNNAERMERMYQVVYLGSTIAMDLRDADTIWSNIVSKNRNMIRKAEKSGVIVTQGREPERFAAFQRMYNETMRKDRAEAYYYFEDAFYESIRTDLCGNAQVFLAAYEDRPIAGAIMIYANGRLNYHLSGSDMAYRPLAPTNLILYRAALWGSENGYKTFHLGGGLGSQEDSLYKFKRAFYRGEPRRFAIGKKIFLREIYQELNAARADTPESAFFPEYRRPAAQSEE